MVNRNVRKEVVLILLLCQIFWCWSYFKSYGINDGCGSYNDKVVVKEVRTYSGLVRVVCTNFIESLESVLELACMVGGLSEKKLPVKSSPERKEVLYFSSVGEMLGSMMFKVGSVFKVVEGILLGSEDLVLVMVLSNLWLLGIFLYLMRLRYIYLLPRGSIDRIIRYLGYGIRNPNCFCGGVTFTEAIRVFYLYGVYGIVKILAESLNLKVQKISFYKNLGDINL